MSQPQIYQTMFYQEGWTNAVLVTRKGKKVFETHPPFATALRALKWCQKHRAGFVYTPADPTNN